MEYETIEILKEETYRSKPMLNMTDNMVRVTLICSRNEWREIKRHLTSTMHSDGEGRCMRCNTVKIGGGNVCLKCGGMIRRL